MNAIVPRVVAKQSSGPSREIGNRNLTARIIPVARRMVIRSSAVSQNCALAAVMRTVEE